MGFAVVIKNILEQHKQPVLPLSKLISTIQAARKYHSYEYFNSKCASKGNLQTKGKGKGGVGQQGKRLKTNSSFSNEMDEENGSSGEDEVDEFQSKQRADRDSLLAIDARIDDLERAIANYKLPAK